MSIRALALGVFAIIALAIVGVVVAAPELAKDIPIIGPTFQTNYYANIDYTVQVNSGNPAGLNLNNITLVPKIVPLSIGGFGLFGPEQWKGKVVITSINSQSVQVAQVERDVEVDTGWFQTHGWKDYSDSIKLGIAGSGVYTIKMQLFDLNGTKVDEVTTTRTI